MSLSDFEMYYHILQTHRWVIYIWKDINAASLNSNSYSSKGVVAGHSGQFTPGGYLSTL